MKTENLLNSIFKYVEDMQIADESVKKKAKIIMYHQTDVTSK